MSRPARPRRREARMRVVGVWALVTALFGAWSAVVPIAGAPDEPDHLLRAVAVVRGQVSSPLEVEASLPSKGPRSVVDVPSAYAELEVAHACFLREVDVPASCQEPIARTPGPTTRAVTAAGQYNPAYYALVGLPTLLPWPEVALHLSRLLSAACVGGFVAWSVRAADTFVALGPRAALAMRAGVWVGLTPMVAFLAGTLNSHALEIATSLSLWTAMLALAVLPARGDATPRSGTPAGAAGLLLQAGVSAAVLCLLRPVSPLWALLGVALPLLVAGLPRTLALLRLPLSAAVGALGAVVTAVVLGWTLTRGDLVGATMPHPEFADPAAFLANAVASWGDHLREAVGVFGWADTPAPGGVFLAWAVAVLALVGLAFVHGARGPWLPVLVVGALVWVALPVALNWSTRVEAGYIWQGRYGLALAVGLVQLAAVGLALAAQERPPRWLRPVVIGLGVLLTVGHAASLVRVAHRYGTGLDVPLTVAVDALGVGDAATLAAACLAGTLAAAALAWTLLGRPALVLVPASGRQTVQTEGVDAVTVPVAGEGAIGDAAEDD